ncbi:MAG: RIP metalloprotease RseP [Candidatus Wallbacteria bacterium HGW-Wallbacteria-1]|jgi:regulator of sigma E protease|uniref:Zinc metalloprotease n=1 Tax=Candidatus Wallbacteria bacterium HGW-Wallbacteria-1 TaxID=2013854 RepID=A0A2N1PQC1_9BACT|nr:MAG: RIP metalloprotease RseP [Candidatus Wallbacteria bacterium HGW-Wallbacteria-1]
MLTVLSFLLAIGIIAMVHEIGHFVVARRKGVGVKEFAIGFGPKVFGVTRGGTEYNLRLFPIAGFVDLKGMDPEEELESEDEAFRSKSPMARAAVLVAGALMNIVLAILVWWTVYYLQGAPAPMKPVIGLVKSGGVAEQAGLRSGDRVLAINGQSVESYYDLLKTVSISPGIELDFKVVSTLPSVPAIGDSTSSMASETAGSAANAAVNAIAARNVKITPVPDPKANGAGHIQVELITQPPIVGRVIDGRPASKAGFKTDDRIVTVTGQPVSSWSRMSELIGRHAGQEIEVGVMRRENGIDSFRTLLVTPEASGETIEATDDQGKLIKYRRGLVGITNQLAASTQRVSIGIVGALKASLKKTWNTCGQVLDGLYLIFTFKMPGGLKNASGPVGIARMTGEFAERSFSMFVEWVALLSTYIGLFNLIPFPALDGGRLVFIFLEVVRGRKLKSGIEETVHTVGLLLLLGMLVVVTYFDISKWVSNM